MIFIKKLIILFVFTITIIVGMAMSNNLAQAKDLESIIKNEKNYYLTNNQITVLGNYPEITPELIKIYEADIAKGKTIIIYDIKGKNTSFHQDELEAGVIATIYKNINGINYRRTFTSNEKNKKILFEDLNSYFKDVMVEFESKEKVVNSQTTLNSTTTWKKAFDDGGAIVGKPHGKINWNTVAHYTEIYDTSIVYIVETKTEFQPGSILKANGLSGYDDAKNQEGYMHTSIKREPGYYSVSGFNPIGKDYWPVNSPGTVTVTSGFGIGATIGLSKKDGFSGEITGNYSYSKSYTDSNPSLSAQTLITNTKYSWYYTYNGDKNETFHLESGMIVELKQGGYFPGQFIFRHDFKMVTDRGFWYKAKTFYGDVERKINAYKNPYI